VKKNTPIFKPLFLGLILLLVSNGLKAQYDVALNLSTIATSPVKYGTSIPFNVTVYNQSSSLTVQNIDVIVRTKAGFTLDPSINAIWTPDPILPFAYTTRIPIQIEPLSNTLITINLKPEPGLDTTLWDISAEIFGVQDIGSNDVSNLDGDSPHDKSNINDGGGLIGSPSDNALNGNGTGLPNSPSATTDEDDHDVAFARIYDVAMKKILITPGPHKYGDTLQFNTIAYNQGNENTGLVIIQELLTEGYSYLTSLNGPLGWSGSAPKPKYSFDNLRPLDSIIIPVKLVLLSTQFDEEAWNNYTELFSVRDRSNVNVGPNEADSSPNTNNTYENNVLPGSIFDNQILGNGQSFNEDEDDHDVAAPRIFDLAIKKERQTAVPSYSYTQNVSYNATVYNQGNITANSITITDTLPCGLEFLPGLNPGWSISAPGKISYTISTPLAGATNTTIPLTFGVNPCYINPADGWTNYIEISNAIPADGGPNLDIDGTFDNILSNDFQFNNISNNNIVDKTNVNEDEDNHDLEKIEVVDIALRKTLATLPPYSYGQTLDFKIKVFNQGNVPLTNIKIKDYIPQGYEYLPANTTAGWSTIDTTFLITSVLLPNDSLEISILLKLIQGNSRKDWINYAHVSNLQDTVGNNRFDDADSFPLINPTEFTIEPGKPGDNNIFVNGPSNQNRDEDDHDPAGFEVLDLSLNKTILNPAPTYNYGDPISFQIDVKNEAGTAASLIEVTDYLPCGFTFNPASNNGWMQNGNLLKYTSNAPLSAGNTLSLALNLTIGTCATPNIQSWNNKAEISMSIDSLSTGINDIDSNPDTNPNNDVLNEDDIDSSGIKIFDLSLDKKLPAVTTNLSIGNSITYTFDVKNEGNVTALNTIITDYLPCGLNFVSASNSGWTISGSNVNYTIPILIPGQTISVALTLTIVSCSTANAYRNIAEITATNGGNFASNDVDSTPDTNPNNDPPNEDDHDIETISVAGFDLSLDKVIASTPTNYTYGSTIVYNIIVTNQGLTSASNISIVDYLRCGYSFSNIGNTGWAQVGNNLNYTIAGPIAPNTSVTIPLNLTLQQCNNFTSKPYSNKAEISNSPPDIDSNPDSNPNNDVPGEDDVDSTNLEVYDLSLVKTLNNPLPNYNIGQNISFNLAIKNEGNVTATNVKITDYLPCGLTFITAGNPGWTLNLVNNFYEYIIPSIASGQTINITLNVTTTACSSQNAYTNKGEISGGNGPNGPGKDVDSTPDNNPNNDPEEEDDSDGESINLLNSSVGDFVWNDTNGNGIQDTGEPGLNNVGVTLYTATGSIVGSTFTNSAGAYVFSNITPGNYYIKFTPLAQYSFINANSGSNDNIDSDVTGAFGQGTTSLFTVLPGVNNLTVDAGLYICTKIGELVWYDVDKDDIHDQTENGINGLTVRIFRQQNGTWTLFGTQITGQKPGTPSDDGFFQFCVPPGTYYVSVVMPPLGLVQARPNILGSIPIGQANEPTTDSDLTNMNGPGSTPTFTVVSGQNISSIGAGYYPMATAGNLVWEDSNINGIQDVGETKIQNVLVEAFDQNNNKIGEDYTDSEGLYKIDYLSKENYYLKFTPPLGYGMTISNNSNEDTDSDVDHSFGLNTTGLFSMEPGINYLNIDAGLAFGVLPVKYDYIRGEAKENFNSLTWQTAIEINADKFIIERYNENNNTFDIIGEVKAKGNSSTSNQYSFEDHDLKNNGLFTYRLKQYDFDGNFDFSNEVQVFVTKKETQTSSIFPNPTREKCFINIPNKKVASVQLISPNGQVLIKNTYLGDNIYTLKLNDLPKGIYTIQINFDEKVEVHKLIVIE
jgi:uncharacterized repeat protein (TIGR01451 family)